MGTNDNDNPVSCLALRNECTPPCGLPCPKLLDFGSTVEGQSWRTERRRVWRAAAKSWRVGERTVDCHHDMIGEWWTDRTAHHHWFVKCRPGGPLQCSESLAGHRAHPCVGRGHWTIFWGRGRSASVKRGRSSWRISINTTVFHSKSYLYA
jgi:hypothetical protein